MYDEQLGRWHVIDPQSQFYSPYLAMGNNPVVMVDPNGELVFLIPHIGYSKSGGLSIGLEVGIGIPGVSSASITGGYSFGSKSAYWSAQGYVSGFYAGYGSSGAFGGWGYQYAGLSAGLGYGTDGWNVGLSYGRSTKTNFNAAAGIGWSQKGGFDWDVNGGYTKIVEKATVTKIGGHNLKGASPDALKQKGGFDCLICALDYLESDKTYDEILEEIGDVYDPSKGTETGAALEKMYGSENVASFKEIYPITLGREMEKGNPSIIAQNRNHAVVPVQIEVFSKSYKYNRARTVFRIRYMNPATGRFHTSSKMRRYRVPFFTIKRN